MPRTILPALLLFIFLIAPAAFSQDAVVINSKDWRAVYSGTQYAQLKNITSIFIQSAEEAARTPSLLTERDILLIETRDNHQPGLDSLLVNRGFRVAKIEIDEYPSLEIADRAYDDMGISRYIVMDDSYGYNAISAGPYATRSGSFVLFADSQNIDEVMEFLEGKDAEVLIYGHVNREVASSLQTFSPDTISEGSRYDNNIQIAKRFMETYPSKQVLLTGGEFVETSLLRPDNPIVFIGRNNVPEQTKAFLREQQFEFAVVVGNELAPVASTLKRDDSLGFEGVFLKFGRTAGGGSEPSSRIQTLKAFYLPVYLMAVDVKSARFNTLSGDLEVQYSNLGEQAAYFLSSITIGDQTLGDDEPVFLEGQDTKTITYDMASLDDDEVAEFFVVYGESQNALDLAINKNITVERVTILDNSEIEVISITYDVQRGTLYIEIRNIGDVDAYVDIELLDIVVDGEKTDLGMEGSKMVGAGETRTLRIVQELDEFDIEDNAWVQVKAFYGQRENALIKTAQKEMVLEIKTIFNALNYTIAAVILILLILLILWRRKRKK